MNISDFDVKVNLPYYRLSVSKIAFNITLLNARSCRKHYRDIMEDKHLLDHDVLCLAETQLQIDDNTSYIQSSLQKPFKIYFSSKKTSMEATHFYPNFASLFTCEDHIGNSILTITKPQF